MDDKTGANVGQSKSDGPKYALDLFVVIMGIFLAFRSEPQLSTVIGFGLVLAYLFYRGFRTATERLPGTPGATGLYRYERGRWFGFCIMGAIVGIIVSFALFKPNRSYIVQAIVGSPTPTPTPTLIPITETPTLLPIPTSTDTPTPTLTPTPIPIVLMDEDFNNNNNGWVLPSISGANFRVSGTIGGGKLEYSIYCVPGYYYACDHELDIPHVSTKNFDLSFETKITSITANASRFNVFIRFRNVGGMYYEIYLSNNGTVSAKRFNNGVEAPIFSGILGNNIKQGLNETNDYRIVAHDTGFIIYANDKEITRIDEAVNSSKGSMQLGISFEGNGSMGIVEIDNLSIQDLP